MNRTRDFLVGLSFFGLLTLLGVLTVFLSDMRLGAAAALDVAFDDVGGLSRGARVRVDGLDAGSVSRVERERGETRIHVHMVFDQELLLYADASIAIESASPLGGKIVAIRSGHPDTGPFVPDPNKTWRGPPLNLLDAAGQSFGKLSEDLSSLLGDLRVFAKDLKRPDPRTGRTLVETVRETANVLHERLSSRDGLVYALLADPGLRDRFVATVRRAESITAKLDRGDSVLWALVGDDQVKDDLKTTIARLSTLATRLDEERGTFYALLTDRSLFENLKTASASLKRILSTDGGFGGFLADRTFWDEKVRPIADGFSTAARNLAKASEGLTKKGTLLGMLLTDDTAGAKVRNAIAALSDYIETTRENAPLTTFAGILLSPF